MTHAFGRGCMVCGAVFLAVAPLPAAAQPAPKTPANQVPTRNPKPKSKAPLGGKPAPSKPAPSKSGPAKPAPAKSGPAKPAPSEDAAPVMTENSRSMWLALGFGPSVGIVGCVRRLCNLEQSYTQFKITEDFGYHVSGSDGFAIGANLQQAFGNDVFRAAAAFKMWWDVPVVDGLALYVSPMMQAGYSLLYFNFGALGTIIDHAFNVQAGAAVRMILLDRVLVYVRPVTADVNIGPDGVSLFYDIAVGGGFTFDP